MFKKIINSDLFFRAILGLVTVIVVMAVVRLSGHKQEPRDIADRCMSASQVTINNVVFQCKPVGIKLNVTLPSGTETVIYKKFEDASNEAR